MSTGAILGNAGLVRKVAFPRQTLVVAQALFMLVQSSIEIVLVSVILLFAGSPLLPWLPVTMLLLLLLAVFSLGIALALSVLTVYFRDLPYLWTIIVQVWFFLTPIVYTFDAVGDRLGKPARFIVDWNPMTKFVQCFRNTLFDGTHPSLSSLAYIAACSIVSLIIGAAIFKRFNTRLAEEA